MKPNLNIQINEDQQRSISTALALLNEVLCLFEDYARGREIRSIFYEERNRLTERQRKKMLIEIERMHALMRRIKTELDLPLKIKDVQKEIWGRSAGFWEIIAEMESKHLRGYGDVMADLAAYLDPKAEMLIRHLRNISGIVGSGDGRP